MSRGGKTFGKKKKERRVRDLDTGKVYRNVKEAAKGAGIPYAVYAIELYLNDQWNNFPAVFGHRFEYVD